MLLALAAAASVAVTTSGQSFTPPAVNVQAGDTVNWTLGKDHNVHLDGRAPSQFGGTFSATFSTEGTFKYVCDAHAPDMKGTVTVSAPPGPGSFAAPAPEVGAVSPGTPATLVRSVRLGRGHVRFLTNQHVVGQATILRGPKIVRFVRFTGEAPLVKVNFRPIRPTHYRVVLRVNGARFVKTWLVK